MSSTRTRNKFFLSLDDPTSDTSSNTASLDRWSEVMPPKTALTFAALWDPDDGIVTFSGAELLESGSASGTSSRLYNGDEDYSQFIPEDRDTDETTTGEHAATLATFQDAFGASLHFTPSDATEHLHTETEQDEPRCMQTCASSTFDGLDLYSHDIQGKRKRLSCKDLLDMEPFFRTSFELGRLQANSELMGEPCHSNSGGNSISGSRPANLKSRFSTTTTSTSDYVDIANSALPSARVSETTFVPEWPRLKECVSPTGSWPHVSPRRGVLRKPRPWDGGDATPTGTRSMPCTPTKKVTPKSSMPLSPSSPSRPFLYPSRMMYFSSSASVIGEAQPGRFSRSVVPGPNTPVSSTPPSNTPSPNKRSSWLKLRFAFLPARWKSRQTSSRESDGWVYIDVTPIIKQRYVADLDED